MGSCESPLGRGVTRRSFLRGLGLVAGGVGVGGLAACAPSTPPPPTPPPAAKSGAAPASAPTKAPAPAPTAGPRRGGTLTNALSADITNLDPGVSGDHPSLAAMIMVYEGLVDQTPDLETRPGLATSWEVKDTAWTFKLRQGVKFHDGTPFNAAAVKATFDRYFAQDKPLRANQVTPIIDRVEVVDDFTVRFITKFVDAFFIERLADASGGTGSWAYIVSPTAIQKYGKDLARNMAGTGPFKFVEWVKDDRFVAVRNDDYWGDKAYLDKVVLRPIAEAEARAIALEAGDIQLARTLNPESMRRLEQNSKLQVSAKTTTRSLFVGMAVLKKPWSDLRVRQALNHAIDKESIVKNVYQGLAEVVNGAAVQGQVGFANPPGFRYDPARAKQLLTEAGYANGFSATLVGPRGAYFRDFELQQAVQQQLRAVGVEIKLETVEFAKYLDFLRMDPTKSPLEMWQDAMGGGLTADWMIQRFGCEYFRPKGTNTAGSCFKDIDETLMQVRSTTDQAKRLAMLKDAQERLSQQAPAIWILATKEVAGMSRKLHGHVQMRTGVVTADEHTWLEA